MLWADAGDPYAAVWCGNAGDGRHKAAVRYGEDYIRNAPRPGCRGTENVFKIRLSYLNTAAVATWVESAARCSGLAPCWGPELQEQVGAALLVDPPEQSALKQLGRSSAHLLSGGGSALLSHVTRQEVLLLMSLKMGTICWNKQLSFLIDQQNKVHLLLMRTSHTHTHTSLTQAWDYCLF